LEKKPHENMDTLNDADAGVVIENMEENYYILGRI
jgi:hypothetical protein